MPISQDKDRCGKWMIGHHGDALLKIAGVTGFVAWTAAQAEVVAPRRLPDGLLDVTSPDASRPDPFLIEIETYPDRSTDPQVFDDIILVYLDRGVVPDVVSIVLHPKGKLSAEGREERESRHRSTRLGAQWRVIELWKLNADDLFAINDVGVVPWIPLTRFDGPPEDLFRQCRERIDQQAPAREHESLLVVAHLLAAVAFRDEGLLSIFKGERPVIESPLLDDLKVQFRHMGLQEGILVTLGKRLEGVPDEIASAVKAIRDTKRLYALTEQASVCSSLEEFRSQLMAISAENKP